MKRYVGTPIDHRIDSVLISIHLRQILTVNKIHLLKYVQYQLVTILLPFIIINNEPWRWEWCTEHSTYSSYRHAFYTEVNRTYLIVFNKIWLIFVINVHLQFPRFGTRPIGILYENIISIEGEHWRLRLLWKIYGRLYDLMIICLWELGISLCKHVFYHYCIIFICINYYLFSIVYELFSINF